MRIIVDAMGGDNAPQEIVKGAVRAHKELGVDVTLVGKIEEVKACLAGEDESSYELVDAREVIEMEDDPSTATRRKKDSSMAVALRMLAEGKGDAVVSAGSTGALLTGATLTVKRIRGIRRAALAPILPAGEHGVMLIDCGANVECTAEYLLQFAYMGSFYAKKMMGCDQPRVGLLNVGTEDTKGDELRHQVFALLREADEQGRIRFVGNIEGKDLYKGQIDVAVCDGFVGNVVLKTTESIAKAIGYWLKRECFRGPWRVLGALLLKGAFRALKKQLDPEIYGGAPLLGVPGAVIIGHGSSSHKAIYYAVKAGVAAATNDVSGLIEKAIATHAEDQKQQ